jgi:hypothetical protein
MTAQGAPSASFNTLSLYKHRVRVDEKFNSQLRPNSGTWQGVVLMSVLLVDDQILVQLGGYSDYEGERKQDYVNGLRQLLTDFRTRKVKDFQTISQGIIDYRSQFRGDKTKILPLGDVSL